MYYRSVEIWHKNKNNAFYQRPNLKVEEGVFSLHIWPMGMENTRYLLLKVDVLSKRQTCGNALLHSATYRNLLVLENFFIGTSVCVLGIVGIATGLVRQYGLKHVEGFPIHFQTISNLDLLDCIKP